MELYILSKQDLNILSICKLADYQINLDEETNAKSTFTLIKTNGLKKENYMVLNGLYRQFIFVIDDVQTEKESDVVTVTALDISNVFNRKVIEKNIDTMKSKSIEEFLANTISENFVNSDDTALNVNYIEIYWHTNTQGNVATNAENGLYNFHTFLTNCRQYKNIYTDFKLENLGNPQTVEGKRISIEAKNRKIVDISLNGESTQNGTPTPDNPIEIENVEGKNKFNYLWFDTTKEVVWTAYQSISSVAKAIPIFIGKGNVATFSSNVPSLSGNNLLYAINDLTQTSSASFALGKTQTIKANNEGYVYVGYIKSRTNYDKVKDGTYYVQVEEGTVATPYVPYNSLEIKDIGENLFDINKRLQGTINSEGDLEISRNVNKFYEYDFKENTQYTFSAYVKNENENKGNVRFKIVYKDGTENGEVLLNRTTIYEYITYTSALNKTIDYIAINYGSGGIMYIKNGELQIEEGTQATPYKPYQEQKVDFPLSEGQKLYEGSYLADDGIHHKRKQYVITGNETIEKIWIDDDTHHVFAIKASLPVPQISDKTYKEYLCNTYRVLNYDGGIDSIWANRKDNNTNYTTAMAIDYTNSSLSLRGRIIIKDMSIDDIDKMKTYLSEQYSNGTPVIVEYELLEEEIVPYTTEQQEAWDKIKNLTLFEGVNHISSDANMVLKYYPLEPVGLKFVLRIDIENKEETTELIDTTLPEVADYNKIYEEDVTAKVQVYIREDGSEYNLYLKTDRTTTTNKDDPDRASGKIEVISVETADKASEEALNVMKGNNYKHLVEFKIAKTSKLMDITELYIGRPIRIKTDDDIYDSYISSITLTDENFVCFKSGSLRTTLIDKLKKKNESIGNKVDASGGKITGNLDIKGTLKNKGKSFLDLTYPIGSIYMSIENTNPSSLFGGTWKLERTFQGGELLAFGTSYNLNTADTLDNSTYKAWSEIFTTSNQSITSKNYVDGILIFDYGTFKVNTKGIVGYVEATLILSGNGNENSNSIWFGENKNALPSGIVLMGNPRALNTIGYKGAYGGTSNQYCYRVDTTEDLGFYINPQFISYPAGAEFYPGSGGTKCSLNVKVYSSGGTKYMWKRIA